MPPPSMYDEATALAIVDKLAEGVSLRSICKQKGMPARMTVYKWLRQYPDFAALMVQARHDQADSLADDILQIADDQRIDPQARRVQVDARKWIAAHLNVGRYGDRVQQQHSGEVTVVTLDQKGDDAL